MIGTVVGEHTITNLVVLCARWPLIYFALTIFSVKSFPFGHPLGSLFASGCVVMLRMHPMTYSFLMKVSLPLVALSENVATMTLSSLLPHRTWLGRKN